MKLEDVLSLIKREKKKSYIEGYKDGIALIIEKTPFVMDEKEEKEIKSHIKVKIEE